MKVNGMSAAKQRSRRLIELAREGVRRFGHGEVAEMRTRHLIRREFRVMAEDVISSAIRARRNQRLSGLENGPKNRPRKPHEEVR